LAYSLDSSHSIDLLNEQLAPIQDSNNSAVTAGAIVDVANGVIEGSRLAPPEDLTDGTAADLLID